MAANVRIDFTVGGDDAVRRAVTSILQATQSASREEIKTAKKTADTVNKVKKEGAKKSADAVEKEDEAASKRAAARQRRDQERLGASMAADIRTRERHEKRKEALESGAARRRQAMLGASMAKDVNDTQRSARRKQEILGASMARDVAETRRAARRKQELQGASMAADIAETARAEKRKEDIKKTSARRRQEALGASMAADISQADRDDRRAKQAADREDRRAKQAAGRKADRAAKASTAATRGLFTDTGEGAARGLRSGVGVLAAGGGLLAGAVGTQGIMSAVDSQMALQSAAAQLAADVRSGDGKFLDQNALISDSQRVARATGIKSENVMGALSTASSEGGGMAGLSAFRGALDDMGEMALASGTKIEDLARVSATMTNNGITDSKAQMAGMRAINAAAKEGNVNFRDMASSVMEVAGKHTAMAFDGTAERRIALSSGLMQMAKGATGSAAEAATSASSFMADLVGDKSTKFLKSKGKSAYTTNAKGQKVARDVEELTVELFKQTKGDPEKLSKIFDIRSKATQAKFSTAFAANGEQGIRDLFKQFTGATQSKKQVTEEADLQKGTAANQVARSMEDFKAKVGTELLPVLVQMIPHFKVLAETVAGMAKDFAAAPKEMIAKFLAASVALSAAQAAVGNVAGRAAGSLLDKFLGRVATMNVTAGAVNMAGNAGSAIAANPGRAAAALGAGVAGFAVGALAFNAAEGAVNQDTKAADTRGAAMEAYSITGAIKGGKERKGDRERLLQLQQTIKAEQEKSAWSRFKEGTGKAYDRVAGGDVSGESIAGLALRGVGDAIYGGQQAGGDKTSQDALKDIADALAKPKPQDDVVAAINGLSATMQAANLQGPKAPAP